MNTARPLLDFVERWTGTGDLADAADEFCIVLARPELQDEHSSEAYHTAVQIRSPPAGQPLSSVVPRFLHPSLNTVRVRPASSAIPSPGPHGSHPHPKILLLGKTVRLLDDLDEMPAPSPDKRVQSDPLACPEPGSFFQTFVGRLAETLSGDPALGNLGCWKPSSVQTGLDAHAADLAADLAPSIEAALLAVGSA